MNTKFKIVLILVSSFLITKTSFTIFEFTPKVGFRREFLSMTREKKNSILKSFSKFGAFLSFGGSITNKVNLKVQTAQIPTISVPTVPFVLRPSPVSLNPSKVPTKTPSPTQASSSPVEIEQIGKGTYAQVDFDKNSVKLVFDDSVKTIIEDVIVDGKSVTYSHPDF